MTNITPTSDLSGLLGKVEEATGPDRELDALILAAVLCPDAHAVEKSPINGAWCVYYTARHGRKTLWETPPPFRQMSGLTASLDASLALCERQKASGIDAAQLLHQALEDLANGGWRDDQPIGPQIALCLLAAMLRALIAQGEAGTAEPVSRSGRK